MGDMHEAIFLGKFNIGGGGTSDVQDLVLTMDPLTYVITAYLVDGNGTRIGTECTIDIPLESTIVGVSFDNVTKYLTFTLTSGATLTVPLGDIIYGLQPLIDAQHKLSASLVDDTQGRFKFTYVGTQAQYATDAASIPEGTPVIITDDTEESYIDMLVSDMYSQSLFYDGYSDDNSGASAPNRSPFIIVPKAHGWVESLTVSIYSTGFIHIGTIKSQYVVPWGVLDESKIKVHEKCEFETTGKQTYTLKSPMKVENDEYVVFTILGDTAEFFYGEYGNDKTFFYPVNNTVRLSTNSLGITFNGVSLTCEALSIYKNKKLSILGDSISTYSGYIPSGNVTYYPAGTIQSVNDTWWKKLIDALGMVLDVNNSWSGSRVTTTDGDTSAGCGARCEALGTSPDVIIVYMGINDFNNEVALGTYDGTTAIPETTTTFREAYGIMLNKILTKYQTAEVWVCTLPQCERNGETGFPEINGNDVALAEFNKAIVELANAFGVKVLDHNKCGLTYQNMPTYNPDNLHPNQQGHSLMANNAIRQMDNFVRIRY